MAPTPSKLATLAALASIARAQTACTLKTETHPSLTWQTCVSGGTCTDQQGSIVVDANWRWTHSTDGSTNCYTGNEWDTTLCPDSKTCTANCCIDGADYEGTYGVKTSDSQVSLQLVTKAEETNVGGRMYLMSADDETYERFTLLGNEFTFDVDVSKLDCGLNGALYFVSMETDGGASTFSNAGAGYGTGYCDSQCPRDLKFIDGKANVEGWTPSTNDANAGVGNMGACCAEMDIWEANAISTALTPHPCTNSAYHSCEGDANCGGTYSADRYAGDCDPDGCDFNPFRLGNESFYGPGNTIDTNKTMTVVTQFIEDGGALSAIKRFYVQDGRVVANSESSIEGAAGYTDITTNFCTAQKTAFGDTDYFTQRGGMSSFSDAVSKPMVLVMSLWDDHYSNMLWLDSTYPTNSTDKRGTCSTSSGVPSDVESNQADATVTFSNIKFGPIGSTFDSAGTGSGSGSGSSSSSAATSQTTTATSAAGNATTAVSTTKAKSATTTPTTSAA